MKLWGGRFRKETDDGVNDFNSSIEFDSRMYKQDIKGSIAHAEMLGRQGIIDRSEADKIIAGLKGILSDIEAGKVEFSPENEDIHMNIEAILTERLGETGKRLHTARSRNDQVALDLRMYLRDEIAGIKTRILALLAALGDKADKTKSAVMPGYTHLQRAQPVTFAHHICAWAEMLKRDISRLDDCQRRMDVMPLGSGALAGVTYDIDRSFVAEKLGFTAISGNSIDGVSDRDFVIELASVLSIIMMHLSRFSEEIILWCSWEFKFIELDDAYSTGSSIMPQKKNPDVAELVRGKTGRVYGSLITLLTVMKALPLAYNKDMQEDKEAIFDAADTVKQCLEIFTGMFITMEIIPENMRRAASGGFINATDCADYLVRKGLAFRDAYTAVGKLVALCTEIGKDLETLSLEEYKSVSPVFDSDVYESITLTACVNARDVPGGPSDTAVVEQIAGICDFVAKNGG